MAAMHIDLELYHRAIPNDTQFRGAHFHGLVVLNIKFQRSRILDNHATYNVGLTFHKLYFRGLRCHHENCVI